MTMLPKDVQESLQIVYRCTQCDWQGTFFESRGWMKLTQPPEVYHECGALLVQISDKPTFVETQPGMVGQL